MFTPPPDINECAGNKHGCNFTSEECVNTIGSHSCECKPGYQKNDKLGFCTGTSLSLYYTSSIVLSYVINYVVLRHHCVVIRHQLCCLTSSFMLSYVIICVHTLIFVAVLYLCCQFHHFATVHKFCFHKLILVLLKVTIYVGIRLITVAKSCLRIIPLYR